MITGVNCVGRRVDVCDCHLWQVLRLEGTARPPLLVDKTEQGRGFLK
jgi:hypothetical protein